MVQIINADFTCANDEKFHIVNAIRCNNDSNVSRFIQTGKKYTFVLPDSNQIINVVCGFKALNAADMKIKSHFINGVKNEDEEEYRFSYNYSSYDKLHFSSFAYKEDCIVYLSLNDISN